MELVFILIAFVAGGLTGYGLRAEVTREVAVLSSEFRAEVTRLRADLADFTADLKSKI